MNQVNFVEGFVIFTIFNFKDNKYISGLQTDFVEFKSMMKID